MKLFLAVVIASWILAFLIYDIESSNRAAMAVVVVVPWVLTAVYLIARWRRRKRISRAGRP